MWRIKPQENDNPLTTSTNTGTHLDYFENLYNIETSRVK